MAGVSCAEAILTCVSSLKDRVLREGWSGVGSSKSGGDRDSSRDRWHVTLVSSERVLKRSEVTLERDMSSGYDVDVAVGGSDEVVRWLRSKGGDSGRVSLEFVQGTVVGLDVVRHEVRVTTGDGRIDRKGEEEVVGVVSLSYDRLCVCTGSSPKRVLGSAEVVTVRDTDSVAGVAAMLEGAMIGGEGGRLVVVGNGGIALDVVANVRGVDVCWVVRHGSIGDAFFDGECGAFLEEEMVGLRRAGGAGAGVKNGGDFSGVYAPRASTKQPVMGGASVGPAWAGGLGGGTRAYGELVVEKGCEVVRVEKVEGTVEGGRGSSRYRVGLSNGKEIADVSVIVSAIGVDPTPNVSWLPLEVVRAPDGGILVDSDMRTSCAGVFAAGDACTVSRGGGGGGGDGNAGWFQMRLWSQARSMGIRAAHCMLGVQDQMASDLAFDLFTHVTTFLGKRVVLLGSFNGQGLEEDAGGVRFVSRVTGDVPGQRSFVRVVLQGGRVKGAICIGETDLSEVLEHLILDGLDVSAFGDELLTIDLEDIFD